MDIVSLCPLRTAGFAWQAYNGAHALTVIVKATFTLQPGESVLAPEQEPVCEQEQTWDDDPRRSVRVPSDRAPYKPRAEVMLVGHAYAPKKLPTRSVTTRLVVGEVDKSIEVWCDRGFLVKDAQLLEGQRFTKMPLRWERAAGGPETNNPVGLRFEAPPDAYGMVSIANLQPPGMFVSKRSDTFVPIGYGPIANTWPGRKVRLGRLAGSFPWDGWERQPLPENLDPTYFQAAPLDQYIADIRPNERLVLENLHPDHARLVTSLPGLHPHAIAERATGEREEVRLVADTLWIDTDRGLCCVVWRGRIGLRSADEAGRILVTIAGGEAEELGDEDLSQTIPPAVPMGAQDFEDPGSVTLIPALVAKAGGPVMPFLGGDKPQGAQASSGPAPRAADRALPFGRSPSAPALPAVISPVAAASPPNLVPPAYIPPPVTAMSTPAPAGSPWAGGGASGAIAPQRETIGAAAATAASVAVIAPSVDRAIQDGAAAASSAAAGAAPWSAPKRELRPIAVEAEGIHADPAREMVQLLWYDASKVGRMRRAPAWKKALEELERKPGQKGLESEDDSQDAGDIEDRQEVFEILVKAPRVDAKGLEEALEGAAHDDGKLVPPLALLAGDIEMPFDELEALKAAMSTAAPLIMPADEGLKAAVGVAKDFVQTPGLSAAPAVSEGLTARIRDAFTREKKGLPADYLDQQMERVLLSGRHYQKREMFGKKCLRCLIWLPGEKTAVSGYFPEEVGTKLPMWKRFRARIIGEVWPGQDQYETNAMTIRCAALARVTSRGKAGR